MKLKQIISYAALLSITVCSLSPAINVSAKSTNLVQQGTCKMDPQAALTYINTSDVALDDLSPATTAISSLDFQELNDMLTKSTSDYHIPGMSVMVVNPTDILFSGTYGNCNNIDSPFLIGSLSKSFTALAIMQLVEEGKIDLYAPISDYIKGSDYLKNPNDGDRITVKQLLNQTGGLGTYQRLTSAEITKTYDHHKYANVNYDILGKIIENVSGQSYEDYMNEHIFTPLSMTHSAASLEKTQETGLLSGYRNYFGINVAGKPDYPGKGSWSTTAAGYISSSASDMGRYLQMYLNGGNGIIGDDSIHSMFYDSVYVDAEPPYFYGMGWSISVEKSEPIMSHGGLVENFMSYMVLFPESQMAYVILVNANDFLVRNALMSKVSDNITDFLLGNDMTPSSSSIYWRQHGILDAIYVLLFVIAVLPFVQILRRKKTDMAAEKTAIAKKKNVRTKTQKIRSLVGNVLLHLVFPTVLLLAPSITGNPLWVVWLFVKDLCIVLIVCAALLYLGGLIKLLSLRKPIRKVKISHDMAS